MNVTYNYTWYKRYDVTCTLYHWGYNFKPMSAYHWKPPQDNCDMHILFGA